MLNVVGRGAIVTTLLEDVFPTVDLMNPAPEFRFLGLENLAFGQGTRSGANHNAVSLLNPQGSGNIVILEAVRILSLDTAGVHAGIGETELGSESLNKQFRDIRAGGTNGKDLPVAKIQSGDDVAGDVFPSTIKATIPPLPELNLESPGIAVAILREGFSFGIENDSPAFTLRVNFFWRERPADPAELRV